jgi:hypothetical protein
MMMINLPVFYLKHDVSETGLCLRLHVEPTQVGPIEEARLCLQRHKRRVLNKTERWIMSSIVIVMLI